MKIFLDIWEFLKTLRFVDYVFFIAVLILMILIITLIYFIKINKTEEENNTLHETAEMKIVKELKSGMKSEGPSINFTDYEQDQEDKAIISYEELLNKGNTNYELNYEKEEVLDDLTIKKVDLDNLMSSKEVKNAPSVEVRVISFAKEEAFLQALKQLQKELG